MYFIIKNGMGDWEKDKRLEHLREHTKKQREREGQREY